MLGSLKDKVKNADVINLGSQYAYYDFFYDELTIKGVNLAGLPQYLNYDYKILKKISHYIRPATKILIVLPDFVFAVNSRLMSRNLEKNYRLFFPWEIEDFSFSYMLNVYQKAVFHRFKSFIKKVFRYKSKTILDPLNYNQKIKIGVDRINGWIKELGIPSMSSDEVPTEIEINIKENICYLNSIIEACKNISCDPVIIIPPVSKEMNEMVSQKTIQAYLLNPISRRKDLSIKVYNYLCDSRFQDMSLFRCADCLNTKGAKLFTKTVLKDIGVLK